MYDELMYLEELFVAFMPRMSFGYFPSFKKPYLSDFHETAINVEMADFMVLQGYRPTLVIIDDLGL
jgi:hypothetical protein